MLTQLSSSCFHLKRSEYSLYSDLYAHYIVRRQLVGVGVKAAHSAPDQTQKSDILIEDAN